MAKKRNTKTIGIGKFFGYVTFISVMICLMIVSQFEDFKYYGYVQVRPFTIMKPLKLDTNLNEFH